MLNKPRGCVTTLSDDRNRPTVADLVSDCGARVYPVGRLDKDSEGLLLLTNDGQFAQRLCHPSCQTEKEYHVAVRGRLAGCQERLAAMTRLDGMPIMPVGVHILAKAPNQWELSFLLRQGLNRQIRRMCRQAGLSVVRLERVREGSLVLGPLPRGRWRYLTEKEVSAFSNGPESKPQKLP